MGNTYGTWLPGDPRGFRTRHHHEHVEGDYKNPPAPGQYEERHACARHRMKRSPVFLRPEQRRVACLAFGEKLVELDVELVDLSISEMHFHLLARFTPFIDDLQRPGIAIPGFPQSPSRVH